MGILAPLPIYPSTQTRKGLSPSQLVQLHSNLSNALAQVIALPQAKGDTPSTRAFVSSYASDAAQQTLEALIWEDTQPVKHDDRLHQYALLLSEKLASYPPGLELRTLHDLCVAFPLKIACLRSILSATLSCSPGLPATFAREVVPAFTSLLSPFRPSGLYGLQKITHCLTSLLRPSPPGLIRPFAHSKEFLVALARAYDEGLATISTSYGGIRTDAANRELDHWEQIWLNTKVDIVDAFHLIMKTMVQDLFSASGTELAAGVDRTFEVVFALLDSTPQSTVVEPADAVPFLNRSLVADYQYAYELSKTLSSALRHASCDDARMELVESTLRSIDVVQSDGGTKDPGALKHILCSSGIASGALNKADSIPRSVSNKKGKAKATTLEPSPPSNADLDLKVRQVLDILPDHSPKYIRKLLMHPSFPFRGNAERVIEALLEGTAPDEDALGDSVAQNTTKISVPAIDAPIERRNVFDQEIMDLSRVHVGKKAPNLDRDKAETERMKVEILRLSEAMSDDSDEDSGQPKALDVIDLDDDLDEAGASTVRILGDGGSSDEEVHAVKPETILELAYIRDTKLFNRDAETRRSRTRADLKQQTGWTDEQIEGWRIMLERNPKKEHILQKHEFSGNRNTTVTGGSGDQTGSGQQGRSNSGRGRGRGRGRGSGDRRGRLGEKNEDVARERAFKEKHKSSNRRRGYDKKMGKAGVGS